MDTIKHRLVKKIIKEPLIFLRIGLGIVFLLAGLHRIVFFDMAYKNFIDVGLEPAALLVIVTVIVELAAGILMLINRFIPQSSAMIIILLVIGIIAAVKRAGVDFINNINEVFLLTYTPTDIVLHISYLLVAVTLFIFAIKSGKS